jgi:hypothetical protein
VTSRVLAGRSGRHDVEQRVDPYEQPSTSRTIVTSDR